MRALVVALLLANGLFFAWTQGLLDTALGLPAQAGREPQRLSTQQHPERIVPLAASAVTALATRACLEAGPLDGDTALAAALAALRGAAAGSEWQTRSSELPGAWVVATIKLDNPEFRARKEATYKQLKLDIEPLAGLPAEQPAYVLGRHASAAEAQAALAAFDKRGLKGLRVLTLKAPGARHSLLLPQADGLLASRLKALKDPALPGGVRPCATPGAASAAG